MVILRTADRNDAEVIHNIAEATWYGTYEAIVGKEQVRYMLNMFYDIDVLKKQITNKEQIFILLSENNKVVGFAAYAARENNPDVYKLHKLYCLDEVRGKGYGRKLLEVVETAVIEAGKSLLELNVNRCNPTLEFYKKMGFTIVYEEDIDIGDGFWMNDYVMQKKLSH